MSNPVPPAAVDLGKPEPAPPAAPPVAALRRRSRSAVARSAGGDRWLLVLLGLLLLAAGVLAALLAFGVFGIQRAGRPVLDPMIVDALRGQVLVARIAAVLLGVLLVLLGLLWTARSLRPEHRPDLLLDGGTDTRIVVSSGAAADAVAADAAALPGVDRARARMVGPDRSPALRVTLWLAEDADLAQVLRRVDEQVLAVARRSLGLAALPAAVRIELGGSAPAGRVA